MEGTANTQPVNQRGEIRTAAKGAAVLALLGLAGLALPGCGGVMSMFDPTGPVTQARPYTSKRAADPNTSTQNSATARKPATSPYLAMRSQRAMDEDIFGPSHTTPAEPPVLMQPNSVKPSSPGVKPDAPAVVARENPGGRSAVGSAKPQAGVAARPTAPEIPSAPEKPAVVEKPIEKPAVVERPAVVEKPAVEKPETPEPPPVTRMPVASVDGAVSPSLVDRPPTVRTVPGEIQTVPPKGREETPPAPVPPLVTETPKQEAPAITPRPPVADVAPTPPASIEQPPTRPTQVNPKIAELKARLKEGGDVDERDDRGRTLLQQAAIAGDLEMVEVLLDSAANIKGQDRQGWTALHWAASSGHPEVCELLIASGATVDARGWLDDTALHWAAVFDRRDVVELLLARGADINAADKRGRTPLHAAVEGDAMATVAVLLGRSADLKARDEGGLTPLHQAILQCRKSLVELETPDTESEEVAAAPASARLSGAALERAKHKIIIRGRDMAKLLLDKGADVNAATNKGITPLHLAAWDDMKEVAEVLINAGADATAKDLRDRTPVDYAKQRGQKGVTTVLAGR